MDQLSSWLGMGCLSKEQKLNTGTEDLLQPKNHARCIYPSVNRKTQTHKFVRQIDLYWYGKKYRLCTISLRLRQGWDRDWVRLKRYDFDSPPTPRIHGLWQEGYVSSYLFVSFFSFPCFFFFFSFFFFFFLQMLFLQKVSWIKWIFFVVSCKAYGEEKRPHSRTQRGVRNAIVQTVSHSKFGLLGGGGGVELAVIKSEINKKNPHSPLDETSGEHFILGEGLN